jgi:hypothetical protein
MSQKRMMRRALLAVVELYDTGLTMPSVVRRPLYAVNRALREGGHPRVQQLDERTLPRVVRLLEQGGD